jgi:hypothetical protein
MLRVLPLLLGFGLALPAPAHAQAKPKKNDKSQESREADAQRRAKLRMQRNQRILSREEIEAAMEPHVPAIGACYKTHTAKQKQVSGRLSLEMLIRPEGTLQRLWVHAPTVQGDKVSTCIQTLSKTWTFPKKPGFTNAVVPFYFQKTHVKGAGPLESCWKAKGCPDKQGKERKKRKGK